MKPPSQVRTPIFPVRGGAYFNPELVIRPAYRNPTPLDGLYKNQGRGFRPYLNPRRKKEGTDP